MKKTILFFLLVVTDCASSIRIERERGPLGMYEDQDTTMYEYPGFVGARRTRFKCPLVNIKNCGAHINEGGCEVDFSKCEEIKPRD